MNTTAEAPTSSAPAAPALETPGSGPAQEEKVKAATPAAADGQLRWDNIVYDIPLPRKQRKAALAKAKSGDVADEKADPSEAAHNGSHGSSAPAPGTRRILDHVSGKVSAGEMVAILGASGAGKTTLLNVLSARVSGLGKLSGSITLDDEGSQRDPRNWKRKLGYVEQDDVLYGQLTVEETLSFAARLRLPAAHFDRAAKDQRVEDTIDMLRLPKCRDTRIGVEGKRGVSGGERKRVCIAQEVISFCSYLFLDEPTSGLDSFAARNVVDNLKELTRKRRLTTLMTIHQPSWRVFSTFDRVCLLTRGGVFYDGPPALSIDYFASQGYRVPEGVNPADHFIQLAEAFENTDEAERRVLGLLEHWRNHGQEWVREHSSGAATAKSGDAASRASTPSAGSSSGDVSPVQRTKSAARDAQTQALVEHEARALSFDSWPSSWYHELLVLMHREWLCTIRNPQLLFGTIGQTVVLCIILGFTFFRLPNDQQGVIARVGVLAFILINNIFAVLIPVTTVLPLMRSIMNRERSAGVYRTSAFYAAKMCVELPNQLIQKIPYFVIIYWMVGLRDQAGAFFIWVLIQSLFVLIAVNLGFTIGAIFTDIQLIQLVAPVVNLIFIIFASFFIPSSAIGWWFRWLTYISPIRYALAALGQNEFNGQTFSCASAGSGLGSSAQCYSVGEQVIAAYSLNILPLWGCVGVLAGMWIFFVATGYTVLRIRGHPRFRYL